MTITDPGRNTRGRPAGSVRAVVVDDHSLLAQSLSLALELEGVSCEVADLTDPDALVRAVAADPPDLVLLDLDLGGAIGDGSTLVPAFVRAGCRVLIVSASTDPDQVCRALELGAAGIVRKDVPFTDLLDSALAAAHGKELIAEGERLRLIAEARLRQSRRAAALAPFERLSAREGEVLRELATGRGVGAIAASWCVSEATVRSQVRAVLTKLDVSSQLEAVARAHASGWL